jgi:hypothetical protein
MPYGVLAFLLRNNLSVTKKKESACTILEGNYEASAVRGFWNIR